VPAADDETTTADPDDFVTISADGSAVDKYGNDGIFIKTQENRTLIAFHYGTSCFWYTADQIKRKEAA
jgi:hypothetical protein